VFDWDERHGPARLAFTSRHGGVSRPPYDELNLGGHVGDDEAAVEGNRARVADAFGVPRECLLFMNQVHGAGVAVVDGPWPADGELPQVDALVTVNPALALVVLVADCAPVLFVDPTAGVVAAAHAGRAGMAAGVVDAVLDAMTGLGADLARMRARVGPAICGYCYEVPAPLRADVAAAVPDSVGVTRRGTPSLDVPGGVLAQLAARVPDVAWVGPCTMESARHFSFRRDRTTGRSAGVVRAGLPQ
jgi:YfiH family protein